MTIAEAIAAAQVAQENERKAWQQLTNTLVALCVELAKEVHQLKSEAQHGH